MRAMAPPWLKPPTTMEEAGMPAATSCSTSSSMYLREEEGTMGSKNAIQNKGPGSRWGPPDLLIDQLIAASARKQSDRAVGQASEGAWLGQVRPMGRLELNTQGNPLHLSRRHDSRVAQAPAHPPLHVVLAFTDSVAHAHSLPHCI